MQIVRARDNVKTYEQWHNDRRTGPIPRYV